jgi:hypothetical protein
MEDGTLIEWKSQATRETRRYNRRGNTKGLIEIEIFDEGIIDKFLIRRNKSSCRNRHGTTTAERRFFRYKKKKEAVPLQPTEKKQSKYAQRARLKNKK